jgi:hypothetical protein
LGYSGVAMADSGYINYNNPATYTSFGSGYTLLSTGIHGRISQFSENNEQVIKGLQIFLTVEGAKNKRLQ